MNRAPSLRLSLANCCQPERVKSTCAARLLPCSLLINIKMTSLSISKRQRTAQTWCGHGQADLRHNGYGELPARPPHLSVDSFPLRYRVPDFVGGHLTGIMIAERRSNEQDICCHPVLQE